MLRVAGIIALISVSLFLITVVCVGVDMLVDWIFGG